MVLGDERTRLLYALLVAVAAVGAGRRRADDHAGGRCSRWRPAPAPRRRRARVLGGATGPALVPVLQLTGVAELLCSGAGHFAGLLLA